MTKYQVLRHDFQARTWKEDAVVEAHSADAAIRQHVASIEDASKAGGTFIAVTVKTWKPRTITIETKTQVKFSDAPARPAAVKIAASA